MLRQSFENYLTYEKRYSFHTLEAYRNDLDGFYAFLEKNYQIAENDTPQITHLQIRSWIIDLIGNGISTRSANRKLSTLRTYFKFLLKKKAVTVNPMKKVVAPKTNTKLPVFIEKQNILRQLDMVFQSSENNPVTQFKSLRDRLIVEILYSTGMRRAELIGLQEDSVDFYTQSITVLGKGNKERKVPFGASLERSLKSYLELKKTVFPGIVEESLLVTDKGVKLYPGFVYKVANKFLTLVSTVEKKSPHVLRHSFATHLANNGAELNAIKELLGHSSLASTQVYTHNTIEKLKDIHKQAHPKA